MKRKLFVIICLCMAIGLTGCQHENPGFPVSESDWEEISESDWEEISESDSPEEIDSLTPNMIEMSEIEDPGLEYTVDAQCEEDSYSYSVIETIHVDAEKYPALAGELEAYNELKLQGVEDVIAYAESDYENFPDNSFPYCDTTKLTVGRADSKILSFSEYEYVEQGGPHPSSSDTGYNYDVQTGRRITISDVVTDVQALSELLETKLMTDYSYVDFYSDDLSEYIMQQYFGDGEAQPNQTMNFVLGYGQVEIYFSEYELAAHADGTQYVTLYYEDNPNLLEAAYVNYLPIRRGFSLSKGVVDCFDVNGDEVPDHVEVSAQQKSDDYFYESYRVTVNDNCIDVPIDSLYVMPYFVRTEQFCYLYIALCDQDMGLHYDVITLESEVPLRKAEMEGELMGIANPNNFTVRYPEDYPGYKEEIYTFQLKNELGLPVQK